MGRLIDAEIFINWLDCGRLRNPSEKCLSELDVKQMIDNQPTAYDVDRVIKRISNDKEHTIYGCINKYEAIEIVKEGAVKDE